MDRLSKRILFLVVSVFLHFSILFFLLPNLNVSIEGDFTPSHLESFEVVSSAAPKVEAQKKLTASAKTVDRNVGDGSGDIQPPRLIRAFSIQYPESARRSGKEGQVVAFLSLDESGKVIQVEIESSTDSDFLNAAKEGLAQYQFTPARRLGVPTPIRIRYRYRFQLDSL